MSNWEFILAVFGAYWLALSFIAALGIGRAARLRNERGASVVTVGLLAVVLVVVAGFTLVVAGVVGL